MYTDVMMVVLMLIAAGLLIPSVALQLTAEGERNLNRGPSKYWSTSLKVCMSNG